MADSQYVVVAGVVQQFKDKPVVTERPVSEQTVREFTIKAVGSQKLVRITLFPEFEDVEIVKGASVVADGKYTVNENGGKTYYNLTATALSITPPIKRGEREVVNQSGGGSSEESPF